jgi:tetratricopeptide (TPR) repeat protein
MKQSGPTVLGESDVLVLTDVVNSTDEPVFDGTLKQALAVKLEESPYLNLLPERQVHETLRLMGREVTDKVTPEIGQEICERQGIKAMVTGEIAPLGSKYVITLNAVECQTGKSLAREQIDASSKEDVLAAVGTAAVNLREGLGESLATIELFDAPVQQATTSSLEALKNLNLAEEARDAGREPESIPLFQRALEIDPDFALAHARLGTVYSNLSEWDKAVYHKSRAYELRERVSERERLYITAHYYSTVTGELSKLVDTYQLFKNTYPREWIPPNNLADSYNNIGWYHKAAEEAGMAVELAPDHPVPYGNLATAMLNLGRLDEAKQVLEDAASHNLSSAALNTIRFEIAYLEGDQTTMAEIQERMAGEPRESEVLILQAQAAASRGRLQEAERLTRRAIEAAVTHGFHERPADYLARLARWEATFGRFDSAAERAATAMDTAANRDSMPTAAIAFAVAGAAEEAELLIYEMSQQFPANTSIRSIWIPLAEAALAYHDENPQVILDVLEKAVAYERSNLIVLYLRGQALMMLERPSDAWAEFKKILDLSGVDATAPVHTLGTLGLARAYAGMGRIDESRQEYENFFAFLADADDDLPTLARARKEYAALR